MYYEHLSKAQRKWSELPAHVREEQWHYECAQAFAREQEHHQATGRSLEHAEQEIKLLRNQIAQMNANSLPPEYIQFPPSALPFSSQTISHLSDANTSFYDYEAFIAKWKSRIRCARSTQVPTGPVPGTSSNKPSTSNESHRFEFLQRTTAPDGRRSLREQDDDVREELEDAPGEEDDENYEQRAGRRIGDVELRDRESEAQPHPKGSRRIIGLGAGFRAHEGTPTDVDMESS